MYFQTDDFKRFVKKKKRRAEKNGKFVFVDFILRSGAN